MAIVVHRFGIPTAHGIGNEEQHRDTVAQGSGRTHSDQRIHIGCPVPQGLVATDEINAV